VAVVGGNSSNSLRDVESEIESESPTDSSEENKPPTENTNVPTRTPKQTLEAVYKVGELKAAETIDVLMVQSLMAGMFKSVACQQYLTLGGGFVGAAVFPVGLIAITLTGAELFTGDSLIFVASIFGQRVSLWSLLRNGSVSWLFNLFGCLLFAAMLGYGSNSLEDSGQADFAVETALKKAYHSPGITSF